MEAFDVLGDPVRRRIVELLARGEAPAGTIATAIGQEFGISQPAVSQHLRVLRNSGFTSVRAEGVRRLYALRPDRLSEVEEWLASVRRFWDQRLDALGTELARGQLARGERARRQSRTRADDRTKGKRR